MVGRRARPLPAAYVLMYHSERHITVDRSYLHRSLERRCYPKRLADMEEAKREEAKVAEAKAVEVMAAGVKAAEKLAAETLAAEQSKAAETVGLVELSATGGAGKPTHPTDGDRSGGSDAEAGNAEVVGRAAEFVGQGTAGSAVGGHGLGKQGWGGRGRGQAFKNGANCSAVTQSTHHTRSPSPACTTMLEHYHAGSLLQPSARSNTCSRPCDRPPNAPAMPCTDCSVVPLVCNLLGCSAGNNMTRLDSTRLDWTRLDSTAFDSTPTSLDLPLVCFPLGLQSCQLASTA